jgi:uncharacterized delta-60 repeat protein
MARTQPNRHPTRRTRLAAAATCEPLEGRRLFSAGDLDLTFGTGGFRRLPAAVTAAAGTFDLAANGKVVLAGVAYAPGPDTENGGGQDAAGLLTVARVDAVGNADPAFGVGAARVEVLVPHAAGGFGVEVLADNRIVVLVGGDTVLRFAADGTLDPTFGGGDGVASLAGRFAEELAIAPDGRVVVSGAVYNPEIEDVRVRAARLTTAGTLDASFGGGDGVYDGPSGYFGAVAVQPDGKVLVTGTVVDPDPENPDDDDTFVMRLRADGTPDPAFGGGDGIVHVGVGFEQDSTGGIAVDAQGRVVVAAVQYSTYTFAPYRLKPDGTLDKYFTPIKFDSVQGDTFSVLPTPDGKVVIVGSATDNLSQLAPGGIDSYFAARYAADGTLDTTYAGGLGYGPVDGPEGRLLPDGRLLVAGARSSTFDPTLSVDPLILVLSRYRATGGDPDASGISLSADGTLTVAGTAAADVVLVAGLVGTSRGDVVRVSSDDYQRVFARSTVKRIVVDAGAGNDAVFVDAFALPSTLYGRTGDDRLSGGTGADRVEGGIGNDVLAGDFTREFLPDDVPFGGADVLLGGDGNDTLAGGGGADSLDGGAGNDALAGDAGADKLLGGTGNDRLAGGAGDDRLDGGTGADVMAGGAGIDTLDYGSRTVGVLVDLGDDLYADGQPGENDIAGIDLEAVIGGSGNDVIRGGAAANVFYGNGGDDTLDGRGGNDLLVGGAGKDKLYGGLGDDQLFGFTLTSAQDGGISDLLDGGSGFDKARKGDKDVVLSIESFL